MINNRDQSPTPVLSRVRTFLFVVLAIDWFGEFLFLGVPFLSSLWANLWHVPIPVNPRLAEALTVTQAMESSAKGAFFVMAVFGLRSRNPVTRSVLFASMALVPPLNIAFPLRELGFLAGPLTVATTLSIILWGSFLLFREREPTGPQAPGDDSMQTPLSGGEWLQVILFGGYSLALTLIAVLFLFWPQTGLQLVFPWLADLLATDRDARSSLTLGILPVGTQLLALAVASWIATVHGRRQPTLRNAMAVANTVHAGIFALLPLLQIAIYFGVAPAASSALLAVVPLFVGWVLFGILAGKADARVSD